MFFSLTPWDRAWAQAPPSSGFPIVGAPEWTAYQKRSLIKFTLADIVKGKQNRHQEKTYFDLHFLFFISILINISAFNPWTTWDVSAVRIFLFCFF